MGLRLLVAMLRRPGISFLGSLFLGSANLLFGLEPVVEFRAGLIALLNVEFIGSSSYSFFERKRLDRRLLRTCGFWHGDYLRRLRYHRNSPVGRYAGLPHKLGRM